ncbi:GerW family sporulation protein [Paenibacillus sp. alder61]|uniref:GerW family sporulation protein n=1 Tax=Paenibacillus sp. alder61 TaxID=2862948 RepID=UPI001CD79E28|nr:GerW family sporulation protein [Paenibacillus sp. alder61]MCA1294743.1 GerW family sporulation protein [Paenibacillus sp. alder61]
MNEHPIQGLMQTAMENIKDMVDVNTIVGEPVQTPDGSVILPISRVGFGFAAGGSDFNLDEQDGKSATHADGGKGRPFGGGSGGGVSINPIAFLVVGKQGVNIVPLDNQTHLMEKIIDAVPSVIDRIQSMLPNNGGAQTQTTGAMSTANMANATVGTSPTPAIHPFA